MAGAALPAGELTFLFTDIEGSTRLFARLGDGYPELLAAHYALIRARVEQHGGVEVKTEGDALFCVFLDPVAAVRASLASQADLEVFPWPEHGRIRVRMGLHIGVAEPTDGDYVAFAVHEAARVSDAGHGGQLVVSAAVLDALGASPGEPLRDVEVLPLGDHLLRGIDGPRPLFELRIAGTGEPGVSRFPSPRASRAFGRSADRTSFVGRAEELGRISAALDAERLVTVLGPGGAGKTRLATRVAGTRSADHADGVAVVELAAVHGNDAVAHAVAHEVGGVGAGADPMAGVIDALGPHQVLLVLDNCEHVIEGCAELVDRILDECPAVTVLATSREPLGVDGEHVERLHPMAVPAAGTSHEAVAGFDSVKLFSERARRADPAFTLDDSSLPLVASICRQVDGLPLAIELAAARLRAFTLADLDRRLDDHLAVLRGGARRTAARHRTLDALVRWSVDLLSPKERAVFARFAVFHGGATLATAEQICSDDDLHPADIAELLSSLLDRSLLTVDLSGNEARYDMLETIRAVARAVLEERGEVAVMRKRHAAWIGDLLDVDRLQHDIALLHTLDRELRNLQEALRWAASGEAECDVALKLVGPAFHYFGRRSLVEGRPYLDALVDRPGGNPTLRCRALCNAAIAAHYTDDVPRLGRLSEEALAIARDADDGQMLFEALSTRAMWLQTTDVEGCIALVDEALAVLPADAAPGDRAVAANRAGVALSTVDPHRARPYFQAALDGMRAAGDIREIGVALFNLAENDEILGDDSGAVAGYSEALTILREVGDAIGLAHVLRALGRLWGRRGEVPRSREALLESRDLFAGLGDDEAVTEIERDLLASTGATT